MYSANSNTRLSGVLLLLVMVTITISGAIALAVPLNPHAIAETLRNVAALLVT